MVTEFNSRLYKVLPDDMFCALVVEMSANGVELVVGVGACPMHCCSIRETLEQRIKLAYGTRDPSARNLTVS